MSQDTGMDFRNRGAMVSHSVQYGIVRGVIRTTTEFAVSKSLKPLVDRGDWSFRKDLMKS